MKQNSSIEGQKKSNTHKPWTRENGYLVRSCNILITDGYPISSDKILTKDGYLVRSDKIYGYLVRFLQFRSG